MVKVVSSTNGVSDVLGGPVVRYGVVLEIGTLGVEDAIIGVSFVKETGVTSVGITVGVVGI